jgi:hypothetical protein
MGDTDGADDISGHSPMSDLGLSGGHRCAATSCDLTPSRASLVLMAALVKHHNGPHQ